MHRAGWFMPMALAVSGAWAQASASASDSTNASESAGTGVRFSGHLRSVLLHSSIPDPGGQPYTLAANRLRLEWKGMLSPSLTMEVQYDHELAVGARAGISLLQQGAQLPVRTWWDLEDSYAQGPNHLAQHRLHRGNFTWSSGATDLRLGRQRVAWGTGRFWSPLDLLNPPSATALESSERQGVDALLVEHRPTSQAALSLVHAPVRGVRSDNTLLRWRDNRAGVDYALTGGQSADGRLAGMDLAGQWGGVGWRAEATWTKPRSGSAYRRWLVGWDYAFANTLTLSAELFHDGSGQADPARHGLPALLAGIRQTVGRKYLGLYASYDLTPLLKWTNWLAVNLDDHSRYFSPRLTWSARPDLDLSLGLQSFAGRPGTEFRLRKDLVFAQAQWYF